MSAWLVENGHIDILVNAIAQYGVLPAGTDFKATGQLLWTENNRSVNYRYSERRRHPRYVLHTTEGHLDPIAVLKAISCYEYQSCERPDWARSKAKTLITKLEAAIFKTHPELAAPVPSRWVDGTSPAYLQDPRYDAAPRGFSDVEQALALSV